MNQGLTLNKDSKYEFAFENARQEDEEALKSLFRSAFDPYVQLLGRKLSEKDYDWLPKFVKGENVWQALHQGKIVGAVAVIPGSESWSIDLIAVSTQLHGNGIGSRMLKKIEEIASSRGIKKLTLDTAIMRSDLIRLYERHGFRVLKEGLPKHMKDNHVRAFMEKSLE